MMIRYELTEPAIKITGGQFYGLQIELIDTEWHPSIIRSFRRHRNSALRQGTMNRNSISSHAHIYT